MSDPDGPHLPEDLLQRLREHRGRFTFFGALMIAIGFAALVFPVLASIAVKTMIGWLILIAGALTLWFAFQARSWESAILSGLVAVLYIAAGVWLAFFPMTGLVTITVLLAILFGIQGAAEIAIGSQNRHATGAVWLLLSGVASLILAVLLLVGLPGTALWALGVLVGINLITTGFAFVALARSV